MSTSRNYTQNHLHVRSDSESTNRSTRPLIARARSQPGLADTESGSTSAEQTSQGLASLTGRTPSPGTTAGWQPTPGGRGGVTRVSTRQVSGSTAAETTSSTTAPAVSITTTANSTGARSMTRNRAETAAPVLSVRNPSTPANSASASTPDAASASNPNLPSIRFIPHFDPRATRPSLSFPAISRTLPNEGAIIKVGRYSERESAPEIAPSAPSSAPVGFKSKVVSRRHCEFWCQGHQWYIKDVKSSSGTFLNHLRLSPPAVESKPWPVNDGDVVQLGIDFRGGEEAIFRCVKMRVEVNRGWQKGLNNFNRSTHKRLRNLSKPPQDKRDSDTASVNSSECSICLMSIAPCQSLFVAPCSHVWHYKCIRPILNGHTWPNFLCPNCRAVADLEADVEDIQEDWDDSEEIEEAIVASRKESTAGAEQNGDKSKEQAEEQSAPSVTRLPASLRFTNALRRKLDRATEAHAQERTSSATSPSLPLPVLGQRSLSDGDDAVFLNQQSEQDNSREGTPQPNGSEQPTGAAERLSLNDSTEDVPSTSSLSTPRPIPPRPATARSQSSPETTQYALTPGNGPVTEGPMTPRNDAGPFVLDGGAGQQRARRAAAAAAANVVAAVEGAIQTEGEAQA